jgi:hypothetical protein
MSTVGLVMDFLEGLADFPAVAVVVAVRCRHGVFGPNLGQVL